MIILKKIMNNLQKYLGFINISLGIALIILLALIMKFPHNKHILLGAFTVGGLLNMSNGMILFKDANKKNMGLSSIMLGIIIIFLGFIIVKVMF